MSYADKGTAEWSSPPPLSLTPGRRGEGGVNVVAVLVILISIVPVYLAYRLTRAEGAPAAGKGRGRYEGGGVEAEATAVP